MYIENPDEEENKSQSSSSPSVGAGGGGASVGNTGPGGTSTGGNPSTIQSVQTNQPNQSFANVQDYLNANKQQGEDFGNNFVSTVGQSLGQNKSAIDTSAQNAQNEITSGTINSNPDLISSALKTPTVVANDQDKLAEFQKEYNAQYTGPSSFESSDQYINAANAANAAAQTGTELGSTGGREQLLQDQFGVYGQGNKGLDQTLLQNSSAYANVAPLAQNFNSVQDYLKAAAANTNTAATNAAKTTEATKTAATTPFANNLTNFQNKVNSEVSSAQQQAQTAGSAIQQDLIKGDGTALANDLGKAGVSPENVETIAGYLQSLNKDYQFSPDLSNYYTANSLTDINAGNVATPEEYANAAAYNKLTGVDYSGILNPANVSQAGTVNLTPQVNSKDLQTYLQGNLNQRDTEMISGQNVISSLLPNVNNPTALTNYVNKVNDAIKRQVATAGGPIAGNKKYTDLQNQVQVLHNQIENYVKNNAQNNPNVAKLWQISQNILHI